MIETLSLSTTADESVESVENTNEQNTMAAAEMVITPSLEELQTEQQSHVLDIVSHLRKCGLDSILQLPQIVVCGDQSAGKSSVLEALTEIPFPRSDNLCTRYATEIILRRAVRNSLTIKIIPDESRPPGERENIGSFKAAITDFDHLPEIMAKAMSVMGIGNDRLSRSTSRAFAKDVLSIEIEGPNRPQLTLVDLPGLIQTETKGVTKADVKLVADITDGYIRQSRTICLAVISGTNDYANQGILTKVRNVDPKGERTLGIITKPDLLIEGSAMENDYFQLAKKNEDVHFSLGWHVLKNRAFSETAHSFLERNASEAAYFRKSIFKDLPKSDVGIASLRDRLSKLLFHHVQQELPKLQEDLQAALTEATIQLKILGTSRSTPQECKAYLTRLSLDFHGVCKAAADGHYEGDHFTNNVDQTFLVDLPATRRRLRAVIQYMNAEFSEDFRKMGHKYNLDLPGVGTRPNPVCKSPSLEEDPGLENSEDDHCEQITMFSEPPIYTTASEALEWVSQALIRTRGKELAGNFNPLLIGELFWEQSSKWPTIAMNYLERVADVCTLFLKDLLHETCPKDIYHRLWSSVMQDAVMKRYDSASQELELLREDLKSFPINYNHYYVDNVSKIRARRYASRLSQANVAKDPNGAITLAAIINELSKSRDANMDNQSCEEALDGMLSIYKVAQKTFIANVTTQVIERHIVRGIDGIFNPIVVNGLSDSQAGDIAMEPSAARRQRKFLEERITKLGGGHKVLKEVMRSV